MTTQHDVETAMQHDMVFQAQVDQSDADANPTRSPLIPRVAPFDAHDLRLLVNDYFRWLKDDWQLPTYPSDGTMHSVFPPPPPLLPESVYSRRELAELWGVTMARLHNDITLHRIRPAGRRGSKGAHVYRGKDMAPVWSRLNWKALWDWARALWEPFTPPACGVCCTCRSSTSHDIFCAKQFALRFCYHSLYRFLKALQSYGSVEVWWQHERLNVISRQPGSVMHQSQLLLIYLLDRRLLEISYQDLIDMLPLGDIDYEQVHRLWQRRRPAEWAAFQRGFSAAEFKKSAQVPSLTVLVVLVLLRNGLQGVEELRRSLSPEEIQQVCQDGRLVTAHLGLGVWLDHPLTGDIRLGHVLLDEVRFGMWAHTDAQTEATGKPNWSSVRHSWQMYHVTAVEKILNAPVWGSGATYLLPPRPETEHMLANPYRIRYDCRAARHVFEELPEELQQIVKTVVNYRHQYDQVSLTTLSGDLHMFLRFLFWAQEHGELSTYPHWNRQAFQAIVQRCGPHFRATQSATSWNDFLTTIHTMFATMDKLELPHPTGYRVLLAERKRLDRHRDEREIPPEALMDRVFHDGVCALDYDPFARLALTILYFCGTRIQETLDLHLYCILEPKTPGQAYLLVPYGKKKQQRLFPIVEVGMGKLIEHYETVLALQLNEDKTPRVLPHTNIRYLEQAPDKAKEWLYLFDRIVCDPRPSAGRRVLSANRTRKALHEALILAAHQNPDQFFDVSTYDPHCHYQRSAGNDCLFFSARDGITQCPICGHRLAGHRGIKCHNRLDHDVACTGVATPGSWFCPTCDKPLANLIDVTPHSFRHNSVSRAHHSGVSLAQNMRLHGHETIAMHQHYLHHLEEDATQAVRQVMGSLVMRQIRLGDAAPGQVVEEGVAHTATLEQLLGLSIRRGLTRGTYGMWGAFWMARLGEHGPQSPVGSQSELVVIEETYEHMVAQYRYEALALSVSEVALERGTKGKFRAQVPSFLNRQRIDSLVQQYLPHVQEYFRSQLGVRLMEGEIDRQRLLLGDLAEYLRPWWQNPPLGSIEQLVTTLLPELDNGFSATGGKDNAMP